MNIQRLTTILLISGCWKETKSVGTSKPKENIVLAKDCQIECRNDIECKSFLYQSSSQKCWLNGDITFKAKDDYSYVGPKECPAEIRDGKFTSHEKVVHL